MFSEFRKKIKQTQIEVAAPVPDLALQYFVWDDEYHSSSRRGLKVFHQDYEHVLNYCNGDTQDKLLRRVILRGRSFHFSKLLSGYSFDWPNLILLMISSIFFFFQWLFGLPRSFAQEVSLMNKNNAPLLYGALVTALFCSFYQFKIVQFEESNQLLMTQISQMQHEKQAAVIAPTIPPENVALAAYVQSQGRRDEILIGSLNKLTQAVEQMAEQQQALTESQIRVEALLKKRKKGKG
jgi:hypothetical protein